MRREWNPPSPPKMSMCKLKAWEDGDGRAKSSGFDFFEPKALEINATTIEAAWGGNFGQRGGQLAQSLTCHGVKLFGGGCLVGRFRQKSSERHLWKNATGCSGASTTCHAETGPLLLNGHLEGFRLVLKWESLKKTFSD